MRAGTVLASGAVAALHAAFAEEAALSIAVPLLLDRKDAQGLPSLGKPMAELAQGLVGLSDGISPLPLAEAAQILQSLAGQSGSKVA